MNDIHLYCGRRIAMQTVRLIVINDTNDPKKDTTNDTNGIKTIRYQNNIDARIMGYVTYYNVKTIQIFSPAITIGYRNIDRRALYEKTTLFMTVELLFNHMYLQNRGRAFSSNVEIVPSKCGGAERT